MNSYQEEFKKLKTFIQNSPSIPIIKIFLRHFKPKKALLLTNLFLKAKNSKSPEDWIYVPDNEIMKETTLSQYELLYNRKSLKEKGIIKTKFQKHPLNHKKETHYKIDFDRLREIIERNY